MSSNESILYRNLFNAYRKCYPDKKPVLSQTSVNLMWKIIKGEYKNNDDFSNQVDNNTNQLLLEAPRKKANRLSFFVKVKYQNYFTLHTNCSRTQFPTDFLAFNQIASFFSRHLQLKMENILRSSLMLKNHQ